MIYLLNAPAISTAIAQQVGHSLSFWSTYHRVVTDTEEAHHLHVCGNRRTSECKENLFALPSEKEEKPVGLTDEEPANRHASERKRNLFILPSEKEENIVNCASECIRPQM